MRLGREKHKRCEALFVVTKKGWKNFTQGEVYARRARCLLPTESFVLMVEREVFTLNRRVGRRKMKKLMAGACGSSILFSLGALCSRLTSCGGEERTIRMARCFVR